MLPSFKTRLVPVAVLGLAVFLSAMPRVVAQDEPAISAAPAGDETPVVPTTPFPSLIALDEGNTVWTLKVSNGSLKVNGDVAVNSSNRGAIWMADSSIQDDNGTVSVVGGVSRLGKTSIRPAVGIGGRVVNDPLPQFRIPPPGNVVSQEKLFLNTDPEGDDTVLPPGIYNGGIFATGKGHITLQPGTFVITNGDFSAIGPTVEGQGITIVMAGNKPGALSFSLGATFNASAPTSGKLKDLLVVSRASGTFASGVSFAVAQGRMKGILYTPTSSVSVVSKSSVQVSRIIALNVDVTAGRLEVTGPDVQTAPADGVATAEKVG